MPSKPLGQVDDVVVQDERVEPRAVEGELGPRRVPGVPLARLGPAELGHLGRRGEVAMHRVLGRGQVVGRDDAGDHAPAVGVPSLLELGREQRRHPRHVSAGPGPKSAASGRCELPRGGGRLLRWLQSIWFEQSLRPCARRADSGQVGNEDGVGRPASSGAAGTRDALIDGAIAALKEEGFAGASAREIARRAGCNQGLVFYHFGSVANLLLAALDDVSETRRTHYQEAVDRADGDRRAGRRRGGRLRGGPRRRPHRGAGRDDRRCQLDAGAGGRGRGPDRAVAPLHGGRAARCPRDDAVGGRRSSPTSPRTRSSRCISGSRCWRISTGTARRRWRCSTGPASLAGLFEMLGHHTMEEP